VVTRLGGLAMKEEIGEQRLYAFGTQRRHRLIGMSQAESP
jgi:hypothetical protein